MPFEIRGLFIRRPQLSHSQSHQMQASSGSTPAPVYWKHVDALALTELLKGNFGLSNQATYEEKERKNEKLPISVELVSLAALTIAKQRHQKL